VSVECTLPSKRLPQTMDDQFYSPAIKRKNKMIGELEHLMIRLKISWSLNLRRTQFKTFYCTHAKRRLHIRIWSLVLPNRSSFEQGKRLNETKTYETGQMYGLHFTKTSYEILKKDCMYTGTRNSVPRSFQHTLSLEKLCLLCEFVMKQERQLPLLWLHWSDLSQLSIR
jgi:hypothetical protein